MDRLLVVEDEPALRVLLGDSLRKSGFEVTTTACGLDAIAVVVRRRPELMVLDVILPDIDGFEVVRRLRADGQRVPVLFLTAREATSDKALSALGVAIGIATMVAVVGVSQSSQANLLRQLDQLGTNLLTVTPGQTLRGEDAKLPAESVVMVGRIE